MNDRVLHPFPLVRMLLALTGVALLAAAPAALIAAGFDHGPGSMRAALTMAVISWGVSVTSMLPVAVLGPLGVMPTIFAYFGGATMRLMLSLAAAVAAVKFAALPPLAVGLSLTVMYLPLLFVEAGFVGRYLWAKDFLPPREPGSSAVVDLKSPADRLRDELHATPLKVTA